MSSATITSAALLAARAHKNQKRKSAGSEPYIIHPLRVANIVAQLYPENTNAIVAALLHDVLEDTTAGDAPIVSGFGLGVLGIVKELTDPPGLQSAEKKAYQASVIPGLSKEARIVKIADQIDNVRDMGANPPTGYSFERRRNYIISASKVVTAAGFYEGDAAFESLLNMFAEEAARAMRLIDAQEEVANA